MKRPHRKIHLLAWLVITPLLLVLLVSGAGQFRQTLPVQKNLPGFDGDSGLSIPKGALP